MTPGPATGSPYRGYLYAYPHKSAYRPLEPQPPLDELWAAEPLGALFLYLHLPFCERRCGFCNLFTRAGASSDQMRAYVAQLAVQAERVRAALERAAAGRPVAFARAAIGGGTPTVLDAGRLEALLDLLSDRFGVDAGVGAGVGAGAVPLSVETSPATATADRLAVLVERGTTRVSLGVQSFVDAEALAVGRPQRRIEVEVALGVIRDAGPAVLNLDLIYGIPGQTPATWEASLRAALAWSPEELYLYPLYVRPLTGLGVRTGKAGTASGAAPDPAWDAQRLQLYRHGRDLLAAHGYRQESMRMFRRVDPPVPDVGEAAPEYSCADDGMVGLGCGARSYTAGLHYSFDYAVGVPAVRSIIDDYLRCTREDFDRAQVGYRLDDAERRRRWLIKWLLRVDGVDERAYADRFGAAPTDDAPQLRDLVDTGLATRDGSTLRLTPSGLERSDAIGSWLVSDGVRAAMRGYRLR